MKAMNNDMINRFLCIGMALIPTGLGIFALLNNVTDWEGSVSRVVYPMVSMQGADVNAAQDWRAIDSRFFANAVYFFVFVLEFIVGLWALRGVIGLIRSLRAPVQEFINHIRTVKQAGIFGATIYCLFFFTIGGDWFLSWKNDSLSFIQRDSLNYATVFTIVVLLLSSLESEMKKA